MARKRKPPTPRALPEPLPLTSRQAEILTYIYDFTMAHGYQPSGREMMTHFNFSSPNSVHGQLRALADKGWIELSNEARAVRFLRRPDGKVFEGFADKE